MSEIKKVTFRLRKSNFPNFPAQMGKLSLFQHETFCHRPSIVLQTVTNSYIFILSLGFLLLIADDNDRYSLLRTGIVTQQVRMAFCLVHPAADQILKVLL